MISAESGLNILSSMRSEADFAESVISSESASGRTRPLSLDFRSNLYNAANRLRLIRTYRSAVGAVGYAAVSAEEWNWEVRP